MSVPVTVQFENQRVVDHLITLLENAQIEWRHANTHNFALEALMRAEPTAYMVLRLKEDFAKETIAQIEAEKFAALNRLSVPNATH